MWYEDITSLDWVMFTYIRDRKQQKVGVFVSGIVDNEDDGPQVAIGWALCNKDDNFDRYVGYDIAEGRVYSNDRIHANYCQAESLFGIEEIIPTTVMQNLPKFLDRIKRYYKNEVFSDLTIHLMTKFAIEG